MRYGLRENKRIIKPNISVRKEIVHILRSIGSLECLRTAETLEADVSTTKILQFRNLGLKVIDVVAIAAVLEQGKGISADTIRSISFSYNHLIGDLGATALAKSLPTSICEIGFVGCGIGDTGGTEILHWMKKSPQLQMICMEQNNFSDQLKTEFKVFKINNPQVIVII